MENNARIITNIQNTLKMVREQLDAENEVLKARARELLAKPKSPIPWSSVMITMILGRLAQTEFTLTSELTANKMNNKVFFMTDFQ